MSKAEVFVAMLIFVVLPLVVLAGIAAIAEYISASIARRSGANPRRWGWRAVFATFLIAGGLLSWWHIIGPRPSDEKMLAHFYAHRAEIESLVKSYREFVPTPEKRFWWGHLPENKMQLQKMGVESVHSSKPIWLPNPYSREAAKQFHTDQMEAIRQGDANVAAGKPFGLGPDDMERRYATIEIRLVDENLLPQYLAVLAFVAPRQTYKELVYFPEIPRVEHGELLLPASADDLPPNFKNSARVFPTLNDYPPAQKNGERVYRQIEPQWFISMHSLFIKD